MDAFAPAQHQRLVSALRSIVPDLRFALPDLLRSREQEPKPSHPNSGAQRALRALIALNVPAFIMRGLTRKRAFDRALGDWPSTFGARWIAHYFPSKKRRLLKMYTDSSLTTASERWIQNHGLTNASTRPGRRHTWLTSNFVHNGLEHFMGNMTLLWAFGGVCAKLPEFSVVHLSAVVLGSSLFSSLATMYTFRHDREWAACGASGIVSAFVTIAALGAPFERVHFGAGPLDISVSTWAVSALTVCGDIIGMCTQGVETWQKVSLLKDALTKGRKPKIGHQAHLAGAAFGALYYLLFLRPTTKTSPLANDLTTQQLPLPQEWLHDTSDVTESGDSAIPTPYSFEAGYDALVDLEDLQAHGDPI